MSTAPTVIYVHHQDLSAKPPVTKAYAAKWLDVSPMTIYNWIDAKKITLDEDGNIPFSELIRLDQKPQ